MKNKNNIYLIFMSIILFSLVACGGKEKSPVKSVNSNEKGTRNNPYKVGDTIVLNDIYDIYGNTFGGEPFDLTFRVDESFTLEEGKEIRKDYSYYSGVPAAIVSFNITSDFQDSDFLPFFVDIVSKDMIEIGSTLTAVNDTYDSSIIDFYAGVDYCCYLYTDCDSETGIGKEAKYVKLAYYENANRKEEKTIYIDVSK